MGWNNRQEQHISSQTIQKNHRISTYAKGIGAHSSVHTHRCTLTGAHSVATEQHMGDVKKSSWKWYKVKQKVKVSCYVALCVVFRTTQNALWLTPDVHVHCNTIYRKHSAKPHFIAGRLLNNWYPSLAIAKWTYAFMQLRELRHRGVDEIVQTSKWNKRIRTNVLTDMTLHLWPRVSDDQPGASRLTQWSTSYLNGPPVRSSEACQTSTSSLLRYCSWTWSYCAVFECVRMWQFRGLNLRSQPVGWQNCLSTIIDQ